MDHYKNPKNKGLVEDDSYNTVHLNNPSCGDAVFVQVKLDEEDKIKDIRHEGHGCSICCSSASVASVTLVNKSKEEALAIINEYYNLVIGNEVNKDILKGDAIVYSGVSKFPARVRCASLAWKAIEKSLKGEE